MTEYFSYDVMIYTLMIVLFFIVSNCIVKMWIGIFEILINLIYAMQWTLFTWENYQQNVKILIISLEDSEFIKAIDQTLWKLW